MQDYIVYGTTTEENMSITGNTAVQILLINEAQTAAQQIQQTVGDLCQEGQDLLLAAWELCKERYPKAYPAGAAPILYERGKEKILQYVFLCPETLNAPIPVEELAQWDKVAAYLQQLQDNRAVVYASLKDLLPPWYMQNARDFPWRKDIDPYHIWLSEIMLQQTRAAVVIGYYERFLAELPTIHDLAEAEESRVLKLWEGLGYYSRARNLQKAARYIMEQHNGVFPDTIEQIRQLPGVGEYTAGAIGAICFDLPEPAIDGNVLRVLTRLTEDYRQIDNAALKKAFAAAVRHAYPVDQRGCFEQSLIELGATVCPPNQAPRCSQCPLSRVCMAYANDTAALLPVRAPKKKRRIEEKSVFLLYCDGKLAIRRRKEAGLLAGLWELPNLPGRKTVQQALDTAAGFGVLPMQLQQSLERTHVFTHVEWHMRGFVIQCAQQAEHFVWADAAQLEQEFALPSAFKIFLH